MLTKISATKGVSNLQRGQVADQKRYKVICSHLPGRASHVHVAQRWADMHMSVTETADLHCCLLTDLLLLPHRGTPGLGKP